MPEVIRERNRNGAVAWLALLAATLALITSVAAYNRTGRRIDDAVRDAIDRAKQSSQKVTNEAGDAGSRAIDGAERAIDTGPDGRNDGTQ